MHAPWERWYVVSSSGAPVHVVAWEGVVVRALLLPAHVCIHETCGHTAASVQLSRPCRRQQLALKLKACKREEPSLRSVSFTVKA